MGAVSRILKNLYFRNLRIVGRVPEKEDFYTAAHSADLLNDAEIYADLESALADIDLKIAFTRREGKLQRNDLEIWKLTDFFQEMPEQKIALVFGCEDSGLSREEINRCDMTCFIPSNPEQPSINLAQAVALACYEIYRSKNTGTKRQADLTATAAKQVTHTLQNIMESLKRNSYFEGGDPEKVNRVLKKIILKSRLSKYELHEFEKFIKRLDVVVKKNQKILTGAASVIS